MDVAKARASAALANAGGCLLARDAKYRDMAKWTALAQIARPDLPEIGRPRKPVDKLKAAAKAAMSARALAAFGA